MFLDLRYTGRPNVTRDDAGKRASQIERNLVQRLIAVQLETAHRLVRGLERPLELEAYVQPPVEEVSVVFEEAGLKRLMASFANMELLEG